MKIDKIGLSITICIFFYSNLFSGPTTKEVKRFKEIVKSFSKSQVHKIVVCKQASPTSHELIRIGDSIVDVKKIEELVKSAKKMRITSKDYDFVGIHSYQVFLNKEGDVLIIFHVLAEGSIIGVNKGKRKGNSFLLHTEDKKSGKKWPFTYYSGKEYCNMVRKLAIRESEREKPGTVEAN